MSFDGELYIEHVGKRLVADFAFAARAGTPGLKGSAKEHPARVSLSKLIQHGLSVGSGIVVDSYGGQSKQQDIVIYENISPVFSHSDDPQSTYFPVEGVVACGEIKSTLDAAEIRDSFAKCMSVKKLRRFALETDDGLGLPPTVSFRKYSNTASFAAADVEQFNQDARSFDQVMTFILCERFSASPETTVSNFVDQFREHGRFAGPNIVASLNDGFILGYKSQNNSVTRCAIDGDGLIFSRQPSMAFSKLMWMLRLYVRGGRTVSMSAYDRYFSSRPGIRTISIDVHEKL
jgi:hypothetical protein